MMIGGITGDEKCGNITFDHPPNIPSEPKVLTFQQLEQDIQVVDLNEDKMMSSI
jgi:hypothetical protein